MATFGQQSLRGMSTSSTSACASDVGVRSDPQGPAGSPQESIVVEKVSSPQEENQGLQPLPNNGDVLANSQQGSGEAMLASQGLTASRYYRHSM